MAPHAEIKLLTKVAATEVDLSPIGYDGYKVGIKNGFNKKDRMIFDSSTALTREQHRLEREAMEADPPKQTPPRTDAYYSAQSLMLTRFVVWTNFKVQDDDGTTYQDPSEPAFWDCVASDISEAVVAHFSKIAEARGKLLHPEDQEEEKKDATSSATSATA